jgi:ribosomal protein S18 acetylase RimI-like enzyme
MNCAAAGVIRPATAADVSALADLAVATYVAAFGHSFAPDDLAAHLAQHLSAARIADYVAADIVLVAEAAGQLVGYVQFGPAGKEYGDARPGDQELRRLYVNEGWQGQGIGSRLLAAALAHLQMAAAETIFLDVWEQNPRAIALYARHGFVVVGTRPFAVASGAETSPDLIMARQSRTQW